MRSRLGIAACSSASDRRGGRSPCRRSGSRRPRRGPWARSGRSGRSTLAGPKSGEQLDQIAPMRGGGEEGDDRLGDVRQVGDDAVAALDPEPAQAGGDRGDLGAQLAPAQLVELAQLGGVEDRRLGVVLAGEDVLGVVEAGAGEPLGARASRGSRGPASGSPSAWTSKKSQIADQKPSRSSTDQRQSSS